MKSDIWAFGVLMWEVFSFGYQPYFGIDNDLVLAGVIGGKMRLQCPPGCPAVVYGLMARCWEKTPEDRITASELSEEIFRLLHFCKESGTDAVNQHGANRCRTPNVSTSTSEAANVYLPMASTTVNVDDGNVSDSGDGYTQIVFSPEKSDNPYQKRMMPPTTNENDDVAACDSYQFDNNSDIGMVPVSGYDYRTKKDIDLVGTAKKDNVFEGQEDEKRTPKQSDYMNMANAETREGNQLRKESTYVNVNIATSQGDQDSSLVLAPASKEVHADGASGNDDCSDENNSTETSEYHRPLKVNAGLMFPVDLAQ